MFDIGKMQKSTVNHLKMAPSFPSNQETYEILQLMSLLERSLIGLKEQLLKFISKSVMGFIVSCPVIRRNSSNITDMFRRSCTRRKKGGVIISLWILMQKGSLKDGTLSLLWKNS
jgi:hypothetical protein